MSLYLLQKSIPLLQKSSPLTKVHVPLTNVPVPFTKVPFPLTKVPFAVIFWKQKSLDLFSVSPLGFYNLLWFALRYMINFVYKSAEVVFSILLYFLPDILTKEVLMIISYASK